MVSGAGAPDAPRSPQLTCRSPHSALVMWDEPFNNGAAISEYRLEWTQTPDAQDFSQVSPVLRQRHWGQSGSVPPHYRHRGQSGLVPTLETLGSEWFSTLI